MKRIILILMTMAGIQTATAQDVMTPETLWQLGRVSAIGITKDGKEVIYKVTHPDMEKNSFNSSIYRLAIDGKSQPIEIKDYKDLIADRLISPDGKYVLYHEEVKVHKVLGKDRYPELKESTAYVYDGLDYRHWDTDNQGDYTHVFYKENNEQAKGIDIMPNEPFYAPQKPFGGSSDYTWTPDGKGIVYVSKKVEGTAYATSTNTDLYLYNLETKKTENLTSQNKGYDTHPSYSSKGNLAWLQMKRDGYEADKQDLIYIHRGQQINLTAHWDGTVDGFVWSPDGEKIYFTAAVKGTQQLFEVRVPGDKKIMPIITQLTQGAFDITGIVGFSGNQIVLTRTDFNTATEIYSFDLKRKHFKKITNVNDAIYNVIEKSNVLTKWVPTTDGKEMLVYVILPPNFDSSKKYPTLLYCQGGPQSALSQFYSFRWNFQVMAAQGYVIVAPNRRGMPGHGVEWNEQISKDWGGQVMQDYLSAIDYVVDHESYVDSERLGAIGASYGGYSVYNLAGMHQKRFKTFISHCGVFNLESMYGTTEEVFFTQFDLGGPYWDKENKAAQKAYAEFNPINKVDQWDTPILVIHGGKDYRVPIGQGQEAFQAAQLRGIKSRFLYFPDENHWVIKPQNGIIWQREFFRWLKETL